MYHFLVLHDSDTVNVVSLGLLDCIEMGIVRLCQYKAASHNNKGYAGGGRG